MESAEAWRIRSRLVAGCTVCVLWLEGMHPIRMASGLYPASVNPTYFFGMNQFNSRNKQYRIFND